MKIRPTFTIQIDSLDLEGRGVGRRDGKAVFVDGALPGETVTYARFRDKPRFEAGELLATDGKSSVRVTPRCPYFGHVSGYCGGCAMQHVDPFAQVAIKERVLLDAFAHIGKIAPRQVLPAIYGPFFGYRQRARLSVRDVAKKGTVLVGFHEKSSSYVSDILSCPVLPPEVSALLPALRELVAGLTLRDRVPQIELAKAGEVIALVIRHLEPLTAEDLDRLRAFASSRGVVFWLQPKGPDSIHPLNPEDAEALKLRHAAFGVTIPFKPTDFTQVNHAMNEVMVERAVRLLSVGPEDVVADFFCGLGNFTLPIATRAKSVTGIEGSAQLVARAKAAAAMNGLEGKASFAERNLFTFTTRDWDELVERTGGITRVLVDPPREGAVELAKALCETARKPERIVYVSCNPATLARDASVLVHEGGWILEKAGVMNMFPHTGHVESMAVFIRSES